MARKKKYSPLTNAEYERDADRIAEEIDHDADGQIDGYDTFEEHFNEFVSDRGRPTQRQRTVLKPKVWKHIKKRYPNLRQFETFGYVKGERTRVYQYRVQIKGKGYVRWRDSKGRFASRKGR